LVGCDRSEVTENENYCEIDGWMLIEHKYSDGNSSYEIVGITDELAKQQEVIMPSHINGIRVGSVGYYKFNILKDTYPEKMFIPAVRYSFNFPIFSTTAQAYSQFPKAKKLIFLGFDRSSYLEGFNSLNEFLWATPYKSATVYVPKDALESYKEINEDCPDAKFKSANVSYFYNYEDAPNGGYHWIDDLDAGDSIITIPLDPQRDGFTFDGWYLNEDCTKKFDFETYKMPKYSTLKLYAKWLPC